MNKTISNKNKTANLISMIFFALLIIYLGLSISFNPGLRYADRITTQTTLSLGPTITFAIVVFIGIYTMDLLKTKQSTNNNKTKNLFKKVIRKSTIIGIIAIIVFALIWSNFIASTFSPPKEYPQIYIKADGQVQPSTTQIKQSGSLYTLQANINLNRFYIEKNDITLDGNGYKINIVGPGGYKSNYNLGYFELSQVKNVTLKNLKLTDTKLITKNSAHCTIQDCNFLSFDLINSHHITITNNSKTANQGKRTGLLLFESTNCTIQKTRITGLKLVRAHQNKILQNQITPNFDDPLLWFEDSNANILFNNCINSDVFKLFSMTGQTSNNLIVANSFTDYAYYEPTFSHNGTNTFYHNNFIHANWLQSDPNFTQSKWDNGQTGNYWSNYQGKDQNNDGIGDTPHIIDINNQDNYPLTTPVNTDTEVQPQLPLCTQTQNLYDQTTQEEPSQTTLIAIIVITIIRATSLILHKNLSNNKNNKS